MKKVAFAFFLFCAPSLLGAKDFPDQGTVFEVREESLLDVLKYRLQVFLKEGREEALKAEIQKRARKRVLNPFPVKDVHKTTNPRQFYYDPTLVVDGDIQDSKGRVMYKKGTKVNPLDLVSWGEPLLLVEGDDEAQISWALAQKGKITCVNGSPLRLMKKHKRRFYFDQGGIITRKFKISQVPARISQEGKRLRVEEIEIEG